MANGWLETLEHPDDVVNLLHDVLDYALDATPEGEGMADLERWVAAQAPLAVQQVERTLRNLKGDDRHRIWATATLARLHELVPENLLIVRDPREPQTG